MKLSREIKTGIIVVGGILLFILGFSYLKSTSLFDNNKTFYAVYDNVGGLQPGTPVTINGFNVGTVNDIKFKDESGRLLVTFSVDNDFQFTKSSTAELYDTGIIGGKGIRVNPIFDGGPLAKSKDTLKTRTSPGLTELVQQKLTPLQLKVEGAFTNADSLLANVNNILDDKAKNDLQGTLEGFNKTMASLTESANILNRILNKNESKLDSSLTNFQELTNNFAQLSDSLNNAGLGNTIASLQSTMANLDKIMANLENGEGTLGKLMENEELYDNLTSASHELDLLLQDFRLNPKRYVNVSVFGKKQIDYELPEEDPAELIEQQ
ncbi:MlaD family protein [Aurantibacter sp.]|uniref:MlaD family protein n=1 Tax=Aurantibacter sp. TaxID=2807103 RepID=UPI0032650296